MDIHWKPQAIRDLEAIEEYYLKTAPQYGEVFIDNILATTRQLTQFPQSGRIVPEIDDTTIRELIYRNHRIIYLTEEESDQVEILTIIHSAQQLGSIK